MGEQPNALILGINKVMGCLQITTHGARYTCPIKDVDGDLRFKFKNNWYNADDYVGPRTSVLIEKKGKLFSVPYKK